jgi:NADH-quinone oxidoreductase subunit H
MLGFFVEKMVLISVVFGITLVIAMYATLAERKFAAFFQDRIGPDRAGPFGLLQPLADGLKFFFKEEFIPKSGVYGIMIGGWASNNKYSVLSAIRASSQMISYELAMGLSLIALIMTTGSLNLREIVGFQAQHTWLVVMQPLGFLIFMICSFAEANRVPFDLAECETELVGGYHTEYSSMKLGFFLFAEYIHMFMASAIMATLYFGGYSVAWISALGITGNLLGILSVVVFFAKIFAFMFFFIWVRWTLPRFRYDQLMRLGWKILLPLSIFNMLLTGFLILL